MSERELFVAALHLTDPVARTAFLDQACGADRSLRDRIASLLGEYEKMGSFLEAPAGGSANPSATATFGADPAGPAADDPGEHEQAGAVIAGKYTLVEKIGEGGMGEVWVAKQTEPVKRKVAVKLIKAGMDSRQVLARFEAERQALALMDHPNIAMVLDGGLHDRRPFFVMELVKGVPITDFCDARKLIPKERLALFVPICQAIQHAHQKGIIHRDIKPRNVLVALYDDKPVVKVIDFGVAKATGAALTEHTIDTGFGGVVGTPQYMSPEQATFNNLDIDTRSDVYALGVLLYELLTGSPPFSEQELEKRGVLEMLRVVREEEPPRPSTRLSTADALPTLSANRGTEPAKLTKLVRGELDWIVMKALEKDRTRRYETANGFAADVLRYLNGEAVQAHPPSARYRLRKFAQKHRAALTTTAAIALLLVVGVVVSAWQAVRATNAEAEAHRQKGLAQGKEQEAKAEADKAKKARDFLVSIFELSDADGQRGIMTARQLLDQAEKRIPNEFADQPEARAELLAAIESVYAKITANSPLAMILEVRGTVQLQSNRDDNRRAIPQTLLYTGDRLRLAADARVQLVILSDLHKEWLRPGTEATVRRKGCEPQGAISERVEDVLMPFVHLPKGTFYKGWGGNPEQSDFLLTEARGAAIMVLGRQPLVTAALLAKPEWQWNVLVRGRKTEIKEDFEIAMHDVTQGEWQAIMGNNPSYFSRFGGGRDAVKDISDEELTLFPVESVSWVQAQQFIQKLNEQKRGSGWLYRLPTDTEWEYACRGGATSEEECSHHFYLDKPTDDLSSEQANFSGDLPFGNAPKGKAMGRPTRVGAYPPNKLGLCDMHGNVWQWCGDTYNAPYRVIRGGAWRNGYVGSNEQGGSAACRAGTRGGWSDGNRWDYLGFRLVRVADPVQVLAKRFPALLRGEDKPADNVERLGFAQLAYDQKKYALATRLWAEALGSDPTLGENRETQHPYNAACAAALAATGQGQDEPPLDDAAKGKLRSQALDWLRAELAAWGKRLESGPPQDRPAIVQILSHWQRDPDLAGLRDTAALAKLPAEEQNSFTELWADVTALLNRAQTAQTLAARGDWGVAAAAYARVSAGQPLNNGELGFEYAAVLLLSGDQAGYRKICAEMLERSGQGGIRPYHLARACTLAPDSVKDAALPGKQAEAELKRSGSEFWSLTEQGALAYRAGRYDEAAALLEESLNADGKPWRAVVNWLWLSLVEHRRGKPAAALAWLEKARQWLDKYPEGIPLQEDLATGRHLHNWLEAQALRREAEAVLAPKK